MNRWEQNIGDSPSKHDARGVPVRSIQALAGHQELSTTLGYMHVSPQAIEDAVRVFEVAAM